MSSTCCSLRRDSFRGVYLPRLFAYATTAGALVLAAATISCKPEPPPPRPTVSLYQAAVMADLEQLKAHIYWKSDVNLHEGSDDETALQMAAFLGHQDAVDLLLANHADVNSRDNLGRTALHQATMGVRDGDGDDRTTIVRLLVERGADVNATDKGAPQERIRGGSTPLHFAVLRGRKTSVATLLGAGADPGIKDDDGNTPLHIAARWGCAALSTYGPIAQSLLAAGARLDVANSLGQTPLMVATDAHCNEIAQMLRRNGAIR